MRFYLILVLAILLCQCNRPNRDSIAFHADIAEVKDSMLVTMKFMDAFLQNNNISHYLWGHDSTLYIGHEHIQCQDLFDDTLEVMKNVPHTIRERFEKLILFLRNNDIDECGWNNITQTWMFGYKSKIIENGDEERFIVVNTNSSIHANILLENDILDEKADLILTHPDYGKFKKRRGPLPFESEKR